MYLILAALLMVGVDLEIEVAHAHVQECSARLDTARADREIAAEEVRFTQLELKRASKARVAFAEAEVAELDHLHRLALLNEKRARAEIKRRKACLDAARVQIRILELKRNQLSN